MDEGRKRVLLIAAAILAARKLAAFPATPRALATISAIADAIGFANQIMIANRQEVADQIPSVGGQAVGIRLGRCWV